MSKVLHGDCLEKLKELEDNSVDLICTDPPYGYSFMGKDWDKAVPSVEIWKECLRVLKPGAFAFVMSAPRQDVLSQMITRIGEAGFNMSFTSIYWTYASGFPKASNIGKMVDKRNGTKRDVIKRVRVDGKAPGRVITGFGNGDPRIDSIGDSPLEGSYGGFQPKPAVEVIIVAMKPLSEKTYVDQALKNGKGITWLDDCRIPTNGEHPQGSGNITKNSHSDIMTRAKGKNEPNITPESGRFPANLLVSDDALNDGRVTKATASAANYESSNNDNATHITHNIKSGVHFGDSGSYSRYFDLDAWAKTLPFLIVPKASKSEKDRGLDDFEERRIVSMATANGTSGKPSSITEGRNTKRANHHPTVKPLKLMSYLITLGSRPNDLVLDPFAGSGTTCLAAKQLGRNYIGIEREKEYVKIAKARLSVTVQSTFI